MQLNGMKRFLVHEESRGKISHEKYMRSISCGYDLVLYTCIMPMFMLWQVMLKDTSTKWKKCGLQHDRISMDEIPEARLLGKDNMDLDVWYYYYAYVVYVVYVVHVASMMCELVVLCIHSMCTCYLCNVICMMVQMGLCEYCIWGVVYILYYLHYVYVACVNMVLCTCWICGIYCVHIVLCAWWICSVVCIWCYAHVGYVVSCTDDAMYMLDM